MIHDLVFLFDVDNTLLNNDRVQADLDVHIGIEHGAQVRNRYWEIFENLRSELGYADYLGALERYRLEDLHDPRLLRISNWLVDYPFPDRVYAGALDAVKHAQQWAPVVILSDGDAVFQPRKVERSGLWRAFDGHVLIYVHKEQELDDVERFYPADHYVLIDDKLRILSAVKAIWGDTVTTVFPRQGRYALDPDEIGKHPPADVELAEIGKLLAHDLSSFLKKG
jgi:FMN phosphatase YigB (HAD superfamily)